MSALSRRLPSLASSSLRESRDYIFGEFFLQYRIRQKNMRKSRAATARNRAQRSALRTALKKAKAPGATADVKLTAAKLLDRAARKGLIHRNNAARNKSKLSRAAA
jgi:small subunit ribosomal protein S20